MSYSLDAAIDHAIEVSANRLEELSDSAASLFNRLSGEAVDVRVISDCQSEVLRRLESHRRSIGSFNVVLFGRTGAGKSSLIEALTSGDGTSISTGESDFTTDIRPVSWGPCRLIDTPGIAGWGRTRAREDLEATARRAVETADLVLLAFDTQNQQLSEFSRVAEWVLHFDKPVIGVLNVRNPLWRQPPRVTKGDDRRRISRYVGQHLQHIRDGLASHGLHDVPLVAWHASRAVASRCRDYRGPHATTVEKTRAANPPELLERWSNVLALEDLVASALEQDAEGFRLQGATNDLRATLRDLRVRLGEECTELDATAEVLDELVDGAIMLIGAGSRQAGGGALWRRELVCRSDDDDLLESAEIRRGRPFGRAALRGALHDRLDSLLEADLTPIHLTAREAVEDQVMQAFAERRDLEASELASLMEQYSNEAQAAVQGVLNELEAFTQERLSLVARRAASTASSHNLRWGIAANAKAGRVLERSGLAVELGGLGGAAALVFLASNPVGWALIGASATVLGTSWLGRRTRRRGERARLDERVDALSAVRRDCDEYFSNLHEAATRDLEILCEEVVARVLRPGLEQLDSLYERQQTIIRADALVSETLAGLPECRDAMVILRQARTAVEQRRHGHAPDSARLVWAGEDWIEDPTGLGSSEPRIARAPRLATQGMSARFGALHHRLVAGIPEDFELRSSAWFDRLHECSIPEVRELEERIMRDVPDVLCIGIVGDKSTGKSSLIARLRQIHGQHFPPEPAVRSRPETTRNGRYDVGRFSLLEEPGAGVAGNADSLAESVAECGVLIHMFAPTLQVGHGLLRLTDLLDPEEPLGQSNAALLILALSRVDELAVDPGQYPEAFVEAVNRKARELYELLLRRDIEHQPEQVVAIAAAPYGMAEDAIYARHNLWWVGVPALHRLLADDLDEIPWGPLQRTRAAVGGLARLRQEALGDMAAIESSHNGIARGLDVLRDAKSRLDREIIASSRSRLVRDIQDLVEGFCSEVLSARDAAKLAERKRVLERWPDNALVMQAVEAWEDQLRRSVGSWEAEFQRAAGLGNSAGSFSGSRLHLGDVGDRSIPRSSKAAYVAGDAMKYAGRSRDAWYEIAKKTVNWKFKPWGATKGAARVARAGKVFGALGVALNAVELIFDVKAQAKRDRQRSEILSTARQSVQESLDEYFFAEDENGEPAGPLALLTERSRDLAEHVEAAEDVLSRLLIGSRALEQKQSTVDELVKAGTEVLA